MKKKIIFFYSMIYLLVTLGLANASLTTIGTANFGGISEYNLIWDDNNDGNSVVWLDYTRGSTYTWAEQMSWAAGLNATLNIDLFEGYGVDWGGNSWRLPFVEDGLYEWGNSGSTTAGYNISDSEMGHLYYEEFGLLGYNDINGVYQPDYGVLYSSDLGGFRKIGRLNYWFGTVSEEDSDISWYFNFDSGYHHQAVNDNNRSTLCAIAIRTGQVSYASPVPVPTSLFLLGLGLVGLFGIRRNQIMA